MYMYKLYLCAILILVAAVATAQSGPDQGYCSCQSGGGYGISYKGMQSSYPSFPVIDPAARYLQKSRSQKKAAWILLGTGVGIMATAFIIPLGAEVRRGICIGIYCDSRHKNSDLKAAVFITGAATSLASVPFFIISGKNKKRAALAVTLKMENGLTLYQPAGLSGRFPAAAVSLNL